MPTYGVANASGSEGAEGHLESDALLGVRSEESPKPREGHATIVSSVSNLANTILGSGMLTFPMAMASAGVIPGILTCMFSGAMGVFGLYLLSLCARYAPHRRSSFFAVSQITFPKASVFFDLAIAVKCFGVSISYLIIIKSLMPNVVASLYHDLTSLDTNPPKWTQSPENWIVIFLFILAPLAFLRKLNSLRHTSYVAIFAVVYLVVIVITCYFSPLKGTPPRGEVHMIHFTSSFVSTFPVQVFAFTCAQNLFPVFNELYHNSQKRMNIAIGTSIGGAVFIYEIIAVFGYLTFGSNVGSNIIAMYPSTSLFVAVGQLAIVVLIMFSYPLQIQPCRNCMDKVLSTHTVEKPLGDEDAETAVVDEHGPAEMSFMKHTVLTAGIVVSTFLIAYTVDNLQMVLSFVGSTGSTTISFILPGFFYWKLSRDDPTVSRRLNRSAFALGIYGCCVFVFCLGFNIYQVIHPSKGGPSHSID